MQETNQLTPKVLCATDFSAQCERAFFHALALSVAHRARMTLLHIGPESRNDVEWNRYPGIRDSLVHWGMLPEGSSKKAVKDVLGVGVKKMAMRDENPRHGIADYLRKRPTDILVMATEGRHGLARLRRASVAESVYQLTRSNTLLLPYDSRDLVDRETGEILIERVLFVIDGEHDPLPALGTLVEWLPALARERIEIIILFIGLEGDEPEILLPIDSRLEWRRETRMGDPLTAIIDCIGEFDVDLVAVTSILERRIFTRLRGSLVDRLIRQSGRAVLAMPAVEYSSREVRRREREKDLD